jgi:hypothetical protein
MDLGPDWDERSQSETSTPVDSFRGKTRKTSGRLLHTAPSMTEPDSPAEPHSRSDPADAVIAALRRIARPASPQDLAAATGLAEATVRRTLGHLVSRREARRAGGDRFTAAKHR